jgi:hypothetical protein
MGQRPSFLLAVFMHGHRGHRGLGNSKKLKSKNNNKNYFLEKGVLNFKLKKNQKKSNGMSSIGYLGRFFETARSTAW